MPKATMSEQEKWALPEDVPLPCVLNAVKEVEQPYTDRKTGEKKSFTKWEWEFQVADGDYQGLRIWDSTDPRFTNHPENKVRQWAEALLGGVQLEVGQGLDTDDLIGLACEVIVANDTYENRKGEIKYICPIKQVWPAGTSIDSGEPPF